MILIIGSEEEYHSQFIRHKLLKRGEKTAYIDTRNIQSTLLSSFYPHKVQPEGNFLINGEKIDFKEIKSIYWRWNYGIRIAPKTNSQEDSFTAYMIEREFTSMIDSIYSCLDCLWVNSLNAINMHKIKAYQLNLMAKNGIRVPKTLITNNKEEALKFFEKLSGEIIFKPVQGGAHTQKLGRNSDAMKALDVLHNAPVQFQECINGTDIRVYVIGNDIFSAEIRAGTVDFRENPNAPIIPFEIPDNIKQDCIKIMELLDLKFTGIDIRYNAENDEYVFIEANPSPMFTYFETKSGFPISDRLCEMLILG